MSQHANPENEATPGTQAPAEIAGATAEQDRPNNLLISMLVVATILGTVAVTAAIYQVFGMSLREEIAAKVMRQPSSELRALRAREQNLLTHYQWIDEEKQILRIPLSRAKELTLRDWKQRQDAPQK